MKKTIIIILSLLLLTGCEEKKKEIEPQKKEKEITQQEKIEEEKYIDENTTPISFYKLEGNTLTKLNSIHSYLNVEEDVGLFQVFPSNEDIIYLNGSFAEEFYNTWINYTQDKNVKIGFNIKFTKSNGEIINYNILDPSHTFDQWEYLMNYLYDDYANRGKSFYSHIENEEFNENTLFTAFKMQSSYQCNEISSKILLTVFTYDTDDDFRDDSEYRGNNSHTLTICVNDFEC